MTSCSASCLHSLVFDPVRLLAIDSDCTIKQFILIDFDHYLLLLFLLLFQTHQLSLLLEHAFGLLRDVVVGKQLDGFVGCDLRSV